MSRTPRGSAIWAGVWLLGVASCVLDTAPSAPTTSARSPWGVGLGRAPALQPPGEDGPENDDVSLDEPKARRPALEPGPGNAAGSSGASGAGGTAADVVHAAPAAGSAAAGQGGGGAAGMLAGGGGAAGMLAGGGGAAGMLVGGGGAAGMLAGAGGARGNSAGVGGTAGAGSVMPAGPCDLPACAPPQLRACYGSGACQVESRSGRDARVCFDSGRELRSRAGAGDTLHTMLNADGSICFTVALSASPDFSNVGAAYRDADGKTLAVAGLRDNRWNFVCNDGTVKSIDGRTCGLYADVPPGVADLQSCRPGTCE